MTPVSAGALGLPCAILRRQRDIDIDIDIDIDRYISIYVLACAMTTSIVLACCDSHIKRVFCANQCCVFMLP